MEQKLYNGRTYTTLNILYNIDTSQACFHQPKKERRRGKDGVQL